MVDLGLPRENVWLTDSKGVVYAGPRRAHGPASRSASRSRPRRARWPKSSAAPMCFSACRRRGVLKPDMVEAMAPRPLILALANPDAGNPARTRSRRCAPDAIIATGRTRLSEPGQQRAVLPVHFSRRARCRRDHHQRRQMKIAAVRGDRGSGRGEEQSDVVAEAYGGIDDLAFGPGLSDPEAVRPAPDRARSRRPWRAPRWIPASPRARSRISTHTASACSSSSTAPAR